MPLMFALLLCLICTPAYAVLTAPVVDQSGWRIIQQIYGIDVERVPQVVVKDLSPDDIGPRKRIEIESESGVVIPGVLALPAFVEPPVQTTPVALALHPMGQNKEIWYRENPAGLHRLSAHLRRQGWAVLSLDARHHGELKGGMELAQIVRRARQGQGSVYRSMIRESVREYRYLLNWLEAQPEYSASQVVALGYSMGAQMSLLLAANDKRVASVLAMVPPYIQQPYSPAAPRHHMAGLNHGRVMLMAAKKDPYASIGQNEQLYSLIATPHKQIQWFDSGHLLPADYQATALAYLSRETRRLSVSLKHLSLLGDVDDE